MTIVFIVPCPWLLNLLVDKKNIYICFLHERFSPGEQSSVFHFRSEEVLQLDTPLARENICPNCGSGVDGPLTAFHCLIPDLRHAQCSLAKRSNPKGLASIFSNGFTDVCWSLDGWCLSEHGEVHHTGLAEQCLCVWTHSRLLTGPSSQDLLTVPSRRKLRNLSIRRLPPSKT